MYFDSRENKAKFIYSKFGKYFQLCDSVLDIGCSDAWLATNLDRSDINYTGLDIEVTQLARKNISDRGFSLIEINLEESKLPFDDNSFDMVVCTDVLEHINHLHGVFDDIIRVAKKYVIISLPNIYVWSIRKKILRGQQVKFYNLPSTEPEDRHKWFFSYSDAKNFIYSQKNVNVIEEFPYYDKRRGLKNLYGRIIEKKRLFPNLFSLSYWCLLEKIKN